MKRYVIDSQESRFTVQAFASGMLAGFAHNPKFSVRQLEGELQFSPEDLAASSFTLTVKASSLNLTDSVKEADRQEIQRTVMEEVLEAARYPDISFRSTGFAATRIAENWFRAQVPGVMELHGKSKPLAIDTQLRFADGDVRLSGEFALSLTEYSIKRVSALGGLIKVKDDLKFAFDLVGHEMGSE